MKKVVDPSWVYSELDFAERVLAELARTYVCIYVCMYIGGLSLAVSDH